MGNQANPWALVSAGEGRALLGLIAAFLLVLVLMAMAVSPSQAAGLGAEVANAKYDTTVPLGKRGKVRWFMIRGWAGCRLIVAESRELFLSPILELGYDWEGQCGADGLATGESTLTAGFWAIAPDGKEIAYQARIRVAATNGILNGTGTVDLTWHDGVNYVPSAGAGTRRVQISTGCVYTLKPDGTPDPLSRDGDCVESDAIALRDYVLAAMAGGTATEPQYPAGLTVPPGPRRVFKTTCKCDEKGQGHPLEVMASSSETARSETERQCNQFCAGPPR